MPGKRRPCSFRVNDIARGVRAVLKGGATVKNVIVEQGSFRIECGSHEPTPAVGDETPEDVIELLK